MKRLILTAAAIVTILLMTVMSCVADECSDVIPDARHTPSPNWDSNPYPGMCYVDWPANGAAERDVLRDRCSNAPGHVHFEPDSGSGRNTCVFRPGSGSGRDRVNDGDLGASRGCGPGRKDCEGRCVADDASCCANGHGFACPTHGQCCFNRSTPGAQNGYVCCASDEQCVSEEGPTAGRCVSRTAPKEPPPSSTGFYTAHICNNTGIPRLDVSQLYFDVSLDQWVLEGWWSISNGQCLTFNRSLGRYGSSLFGYHATGGGLTWWNANGADGNFCTPSQKFKNVADGQPCPKEKLVGYKKLPVRRGQTLEISITK
jgi:uncharacterized membrane protein